MPDRIQGGLAISAAALLGCALWLAAALQPAAAVEMADLYEVAIPVNSQADSEQRTALRRAFAEVLVRVTGKREAPSLAPLKQVLKRPMGYVQQFRYRTLRVQDMTPGMAQERAEEQELWVSFDPQAVNRLLSEADLAVWGRARPATLLWLAVEDGGRRFLVGSAQGEALQAQLRAAARRRGLPLFFPLLDLQDQAALHFTDVWGDFQDVILAASQRYQSASVLVGRLYHRDGGAWEGRWTLYLEGRPAFWTFSADDPAEVLAAGVDGAADHLALRYAQRLNMDAGNSVTIAVHDIRSLEDYARAMHYLESLDPVTHLRVLAVEGETVVFQVGINGSRDGLAQTIGFGGTLAPPQSEAMFYSPAAAPEAAAVQATLSYRLLP
ncbi:MAG: DUF2066 domain-containing protein [Gammaproteobacteria bacterium]